MACPILCCRKKGRKQREWCKTMELIWELPGMAILTAAFSGMNRAILSKAIILLVCLAGEMFKKEPGGKILYDPRLTWNTEEQVRRLGGVPIMTRTGHAFIKERMRQENAVYGGEMSAHHYFRDFGYCDSGMIPWLLVSALLCRQGRKLSELVADRIVAFPVSGEINNRVADPDAVIALIEKKYSDGEKDYTDGLSIAFPEFRFNIRKSNTEPLLRLNVESRGDIRLLQEKTAELLSFIS